MSGESSRAEPKFGIKPGEENLAGYLMARAAMHRKVEGQVHQNLREGHASLQDVAERMPLGRANVIEDNERAMDAYLPCRIVASNHLRHALNEVPEGFLGRRPEDDFTRTVAAVGQHAQTGTCGTFAAMTAPVHAAKLPAMGDKRAIVAQTYIADVDHAWVEMMPKGMGKDGKPILHHEDVILDGWCKENTAVLREDGAFSALDEHGKGDHLNHTDLLDHNSGPKALKSVEKYKEQIENSPELKSTYRANFERSVKEGIEMPEGWFYSATSVFNHDFRYEATAAVHKTLSQAQGAEDFVRLDRWALDADGTVKGSVSRFKMERIKHESMAEIQAIGVARTLGSNIRGAKAEAPGIIAAAKDMFPARTRGMNHVR